MKCYKQPRASEGDGECDCPPKKAPTKKFGVGVFFYGGTGGDTGSDDPRDDYFKE